MVTDIREWIIVNIDHLKWLMEPLRENKRKAMLNEDVMFHDDIDRQYRDAVKQLICVEVSKSLGCSAESFHDSIEDREWEDLWNKIF